MQTSYKRENWKADHVEDTKRNMLKHDAPAEEKRKLWPLSARIKVEQRAYPELKVGVILKYARTMMYPSVWPVEVLMWTPEGWPKTLKLGTDEMELLPPQED